METLSYNKPMQKVAEKLGFVLIEQKELGAEYQQGLTNHICEISNCLNTESEKLQNKKVMAMLYKIDFASWPNLELRILSESDEGFFDSIELYDDEKRCFSDPDCYDYTKTEKKIPFAFYHNDILIGGAHIEYDKENNTCKLGCFFIDENYHECGFGKKTLNEMIDYVKSNQRNKVKKMILDVHTKNITALNMYWNRGFRPINYDCGSECWDMELILN